MGVALVLLAAGDSRRFQGNKLMYELNGKPMYRFIVDELSFIPEDIVERKAVVTQYPEIMEELAALGYEVVQNHHSHLGISHSIHLALGALEDFNGSICFAVCDQPYLKKETVIAMLQGYLSSQKGLGCVSYQGELGNPAVFSSCYRDELRELLGDMGGKRVIRRHLEDLYRYELADGLELADIDTRLEAKEQGKGNDDETTGR